jgi:hypothetical protein
MRGAINIESMLLLIMSLIVIVVCIWYIFKNLNENSCKLCSVIYENFDKVHDKYPLCGIGVFAKDEDGKVVYYIPCKDDFYDAWFTFDYCPGCGRKIPKE